MTLPESLDTWFKREILTHEGALMRFLSRSWPRRHEVADLRQEIYARVFEGAQRARPQLPKSYMFSIARHVMIDRRRRERIVSIHSARDPDFSNDLVDEATPERVTGAWEDLVRVARAFDRLPARCKEVTWMRRVLGLSQKEVALRLGVSEKAIEQHVATAGRLLATALHQTGSGVARRLLGRRRKLHERKEGDEHG